MGCMWVRVGTIHTLFTPYSHPIHTLFTPYSHPIYTVVEHVDQLPRLEYVGLGQPRGKGAVGGEELGGVHGSTHPLPRTSSRTSVSDTPSRTSLRIFRSCSRVAFSPGSRSVESVVSTEVTEELKLPSPFSREGGFSGRLWSFSLRWFSFPANGLLWFFSNLSPCHSLAPPGPLRRASKRPRSFSRALNFRRVSALSPPSSHHSS